MVHFLFLFSIRKQQIWWWEQDLPSMAASTPLSLVMALLSFSWYLDLSSCLTSTSRCSVCAACCFSWTLKTSERWSLWAAAWRLSWTLISSSYSCLSSESYVRKEGQERKIIYKTRAFAWFHWSKSDMQRISIQHMKKFKKLGHNTVLIRYAGMLVLSTHFVS